MCDGGQGAPIGGAALQQTLDHFDQGISVFDGDLRLALFNRRFREILNLPENLCYLGAPFDSFIRYNAQRGDYGPGEVEDHVRDRVELARDPKPHRFERRLPDGRFIEVRGNPLPGGGFITTYTDITESKQAEEVVRESEARYRALVELAPDAIIVHQEGRIAYVNAAALALLGYKAADDLIGSLLLDVLHPDSRDRAVHRIERANTGETLPVAELRLLRSDGTVVHAESGMGPTTFNGKHALQSVLRDVTERKRAEANARLNLMHQHLLASIIHISLEPVALNDILKRTLDIILSNHGLGFLDKGCIFLADPVKPELQLRAQVGIHPDIQSQCATLPFGRCLCGNAAARRELVHVDRVDERHEITFDEIQQHGHFCVPIQTEGLVLGVLNLYVPEGHVRSETEEIFVRTVADTLAGVIRRKQAEHKLRQLSQAVEQSPASVVITDTAGIIQYVNSKFTEVTGYAMEEAIGRNPRFLKSGHTPREKYHEMWNTISAGREWRGELLNRKKNGELVWEYASVSPIKAPNGTVTHYLAVKEDISVRKEYEQRLLYQANYDSLTGLPNRILAQDRLQQALARAHRDKSLVALLFLDLDDFKKVNDTLGHAAGDRLLQEAAKRLIHCLREGDTVARLGGDEFTIILPDFHEAKDVELVAEKILEACAKPFQVGDHEVFVTVSIGITLYPSDETDPQLLMRNADAAMYRAKKEGRGTFRFFTPKMNEVAMEHMRMEAELRHALERGELTVHYQPLVDNVSGRMVGAEALLRWNNKTFGQVDPGRFIPLAEDTGLIIPVGDWVLRTACKEAARWRSPDGKGLFVAVNISSRQFQKTTLVETVARALKESGLPANRLELEITESVLLADSAETVRIIEELDKMGVRFAIDDFGTGYSSLSYLRRFPFDTLKIDRSFVKDVETNPDDADLVKSIIALAQSMRLQIVGEGIENANQQQFLHQSGATLSQGWYFSKALPAEQFRAFLETWSWHDAT